MNGIICGDSVQVVPMLPENSIDLIATDPPYGVDFMGLDWDKALPNKVIWQECYRVLKPGAHMFVLALPRMYHRVAVAIEDAGFVLNSPLTWLFASGFPKALDISKAFDKRAFEEWLGTVPQERLGRLMIAEHNIYVRLEHIRLHPSPRSRNWKKNVSHDLNMVITWKERVMRRLLQSGVRVEGELEAEGWRRELPKLKRKVLSAAVNGAYTADFMDYNGKQHKGRKHISPVHIGADANSRDRSEGARLLAAVVEEFWHGEGLPPGVRVKVGKAWEVTGTPAQPMDWGKTEKPEYAYNISAPSTPLAQEWEGWKSPQLKPAMEMIVFASKPLSERTFIDNVERWGTGGINVDAARIPTQDWDAEEVNRAINRATSYRFRPDLSSFQTASPGEFDAGQGRYPANVIAEEGCVLPPDRMRYFDLSLWAETHGICDTPKASRKEKEAGLRTKQGMPLDFLGTGIDGLGQRYETQPTANDHPTCKPLALMSWLIALGCPEDGLVLDPFAGTGTTGIGAHLNGMRWLLIEREWKWCDIANRRLAYWKAQPRQLGLGLDSGQGL